MSQEFKLKRDPETNKIIGATAKCEGNYDLPNKRLDIDGTFAISAEDVAALLAIFNEGTASYSQCNCRGYFYSDRDSAIAKLGEELNKLNNEYQELAETANFRHDRLVEAKTRLRAYSYAYNHLPNWVTRLFVDNDKRKKLNEYRSSNDNV